VNRLTNSARNGSRLAQEFLYEVPENCKNRRIATTERVGTHLAKYAERRGRQRGDENASRVV